MMEKNNLRKGRTESDPEFWGKFWPLVRDYVYLFQDDHFDLVEMLFLKCTSNIQIEKRSA